MNNPERQWFGRKMVTPQEKTRLVHDVFDSVASRYDLMNDLMSGGLHRLWKDTLIRHINPRPKLHYVDVAGGTGDIAFRIARAAGPDAPITISDMNESMLAVGQDRAIDAGLLNRFTWVPGNAEHLPFADQSFDVYTISFGLRNVTHIDAALSDAYRMLKPGGRFFCLEFSHVDNPALAKVYDAYSYYAIPVLGQYVTGDRESYQYLVESIRAFPRRDELAQRLQKAGFDKVTITPLTFGTVAIHEAWKF